MKNKVELSVERLHFGGDIGHGYTKTKAVKFPSRVKVGKNLSVAGRKKKDTYNVVHNGQHYVVGDGAIFTGDDRYFTTEYKIALLTAIALNNPQEDFIDIVVCIGVPIERHNRVAKAVEDYYTGMQEMINVEGRDVTIRINRIAVSIEGAYPILTGDEGRIITIDMGAGTINVTQFYEMAIEDYATYNDAMYRLYQEVATYLNVEKGGDFSPNDIEPILNKQTITINQQKVDITDIRPIIRSNIAEVGSHIKNKFAVQRADAIYCIGGGISDTFQYWKEIFPTAILVDKAQHINSEVFDLMALSMCEEE